MTPEQTAIHNVAIEEAAQALEALQSNNTDVPEEYFRESKNFRCRRHQGIEGIGGHHAR